jgi:hypothetical protein
MPPISYSAMEPATAPTITQTMIELSAMIDSFRFFVLRNKSSMFQNQNDSNKSTH